MRLGHCCQTIFFVRLFSMLLIFVLLATLCVYSCLSFIAYKFLLFQLSILLPSNSYSHSFAVFKMSSANFVELSSNEEIGKSGGKKSKRSLDSVLGTGEHKQNNRTKSKKVRRKSRSGQELEEYISSVACTISQNGSSVLDQGPSPLDKSSPSSVPSLGSAPICRQFWKAGNYNLGEGSKTQHQSMQEFNIAY